MVQLNSVPVMSSSDMYEIIQEIVHLSFGVKEVGRKEEEGKQEGQNKTAETK